MSKKELINLLNHGLELEHAAYVQYLSHAEIVVGLVSDPIIARLKEIADDEKEHQKKFRTLIGDFLDSVPSMGMTKPHSVVVSKDSTKVIKEILRINLKNEREAIDFYRRIYELVTKMKAELKYEFSTMEHEIRHIIIDEEEHAVELRRLLEEQG